MTDLTEFQQRAASVAVVKMFGGRHFSVSDLRSIAKTIGREGALSGRDMAALESLHCVDWGDMGPDLSRMVREKCLELLGLPPQVVEAVEPERTREPAHEPARRLRLAFWRN